jgi:hypothetical protein
MSNQLALSAFTATLPEYVGGAHEINLRQSIEITLGPQSDLSHEDRIGNLEWATGSLRKHLDKHPEYALPLAFLALVHKRLIIGEHIHEIIGNPAGGDMDRSKPQEKPNWSPGQDKRLGNPFQYVLDALLATADGSQAQNVIFGIWRDKFGAYKNHELIVGKIANRNALGDGHQFKKKEKVEPHYVGGHYGGSRTKVREGYYVLENAPHGYLPRELYDRTYITFSYGEVGHDFSSRPVDKDALMEMVFGDWLEHVKPNSDRLFFLMRSWPEASIVYRMATAEYLQRISAIGDRNEFFDVMRRHAAFATVGFGEPEWSDSPNCYVWNLHGSLPDLIARLWSERFDPLMQTVLAACLKIVDAVLNDEMLKRVGCSDKDNTPLITLATERKRRLENPSIDGAGNRQRPDSHTLTASSQQKLPSQGSDAAAAAMLAGFLGAMGGGPKQVLPGPQRPALAGPKPPDVPGSPRNGQC